MHCEEFINDHNGIMYVHITDLGCPPVLVIVSNVSRSTLIEALQPSPNAQS